MKSKLKKEFSTKIIISIFFTVLLIILIFAGVDFIIHKTDEKYSVPEYYFPHKIIYGTIIGFITYLFIRKQKLIIKSLIFSAVISLLLQINYYFQGYSKYFVFLFLGIHFIILVIVSWIIFKIIEKYK